MDDLELEGLVHHEGVLDRDVCDNHALVDILEEVSDTGGHILGQHFHIEQVRRLDELSVMFSHLLSKLDQLS